MHNFDWIFYDLVSLQFSPEASLKIMKYRVTGRERCNNHKVSSWQPEIQITSHNFHCIATNRNHILYYFNTVFKKIVEKMVKFSFPEILKISECFNIFNRCSLRSLKETSLPFFKHCYLYSRCLAVWKFSALPPVKIGSSLKVQQCGQIHISSHERDLKEEGWNLDCIFRQFVLLSLPLSFSYCKAQDWRWDHFVISYKIIHTW